MAQKTYTVYGVGNFGPAHPLHNPACDVHMYVNGEHFATQRLPGGYEAHYTALSRGFVPKDEEMKRGRNYRLASLDLGLFEV